MTRTTDRVALDQWCVVGCSTEIVAGREHRVRMLGQDVVADRPAGGAASVHELSADGSRGPALGVRERYGHVWATLGQPARDLPAIPEFEEPGRRLITCGSVRVHTSSSRIVENFLDMAHFPFVHTGVLGAESHTEVGDYKAELRRDVDEVWATKCEFYQPKAAAAAGSGQMVQYQYRVMTPFAAVLYKTCPSRTGAWDVIGVLIRPLEEDLCDAYLWVLIYDETSSDNEVRQFQQEIFLQDRIILENQRPKFLPLDPRSELPTRADASSIMFRRWIKEKGLQFGIHEKVA
jgi:phenylpropionate dioxygenase-like ring-hydroxylating dioxygenase large terminal subunit